MSVIDQSRTIMETFNSRTKLIEDYGNNALMLFALQMYFSIEDIDSVAAEALTDHADDRKCDLIYIDIDNQTAVIAQGYHAQNNENPDRRAPTNKADDLNTAASWALAQDINRIPDHIKSAVERLRRAIKENEIKTLHFWYVHNLPESVNVEDALSSIPISAKGMLNTYFDNEASVKEINITATEIGLQTLQEWYLGLTSTILVSEEMNVPMSGAFEQSGDDWNSLITSVPGTWLKQMFQSHGKNLFSANIRDYLGSRQSEDNINNAIKESAKEHPSKFWVFNNGVTALVNDFDYNEEENRLLIKGLSVVNGAQTTGALGTIDGEISESLMVPIRFVKSSNSKTIDGIVRYNNSQNKIKPTDFRSSDAIQKKLVSEFSSYPDCQYTGGRRGSDEDVMRRPGDIIPSSTASQAIAAFHGEPYLAYNSVKNIWETDSIYARVFPSRLWAGHLLLAYSLLKWTENYKIELNKKIRNKDPLTTSEQECSDFLNSRGATKLLTAAIGACMEIYLGKPIEDMFAIGFKRISPEDAMNAWEPIVMVGLAFSKQMHTEISSRFTVDNSKKAMDLLRSLIQSTSMVHKQTYELFAANLIVSPS